MAPQTGNDVIIQCNDHDFLSVFNAYNFFVSSGWEIIEGFPLTRSGIRNATSAAIGSAANRSNVNDAFSNSDFVSQACRHFCAFTIGELLAFENVTKMAETRSRLVGGILDWKKCIRQPFDCHKWLRVIFSESVMIRKVYTKSISWRGVRGFQNIKW